MNKYISIILIALFNIIINFEIPAQYLTPVSKGPLPFEQTDSRINYDIKHIKSDIPINVKIIESESGGSYHTMDTVWKYIAQNMGLNVGIYAQTLLSDTTFFNSTDILIIASGTNNFIDNAQNVIERFLKRGRNVYLQCEYQTTLAHNRAFTYIVSDLGGTFDWEYTIAGNLAPMNILGSLASTPNRVSNLNFFWYGTTGMGDLTIEKFLEYEGYFYGFIFKSPIPDIGLLITSSDQDWIHLYTDESLKLMQNILYKMINVTEIRNIESKIP